MLKFFKGNSNKNDKKPLSFEEKKELVSKAYEENLPEKKFINNDPKKENYNIFENKEKLSSFKDLSKVKETKVDIKPILKKKLYIFLIENSEIVFSQKDVVIKIVEKIAKSSNSSLFTFINYGDILNIKHMVKFSETECSDFFNIGKNIRFFDALKETELIISNDFYKIHEKDLEQIQITEAEIIGIGTAKDIGSYCDKEKALQCFDKICENSKIKTKYLCVSEDGYINSAEIGFRSISSTPQKFQ